MGTIYLPVAHEQLPLLPLVPASALEQMATEFIKEIDGDITVRDVMSSDPVRVAQTFAPTIVTLLPAALA